MQSPLKSVKKGTSTARVLGVVVLLLLCLVVIPTISNSNSGSSSPTSSTTTEKSGKDYTLSVWRAFWEGASAQFGVEYSAYKTLDTVYSYIQDFETSDGFTSHYYLIRTAFETTNAAGKKIDHQVTARCYYVPEYSDTVYVTYMTLDGKTVLFEESTEDWLMGLGSAQATSNAYSNDTRSTASPKPTANQNVAKNSSPVATNNPKFEGSTCLGINTNTGMPASNVTSFNGTDSVFIAGRLSGISGEQNLVIRWVFPDGYVSETMCYYVKNGETINTGQNAEHIGSGTGSVSVILQSTGQTLATYHYTVVGAPTYTNDATTETDSANTDSEFNDINTALAEQQFLKNLPSFDVVEQESSSESTSDLGGWVESLR